MSFGSKEKMILEFLTEEEGYLTSEKIANKLNVSTRTVRRYIEKINEISNDGNIIDAEKGRGYQLNYTNYLKIGTNEQRINDYSPVERRNEILLDLLFNSPREISVREMFEKYYVSETAVNNDLIAIKLQVRDLKLQLIRKNHLIYIMGSELNIRRAIIQNIGKSNNIENNELQSDYKAINTFDMRFIIEQIQKIENKLDSSIPYPYNINLFSHIYILINRYRKGVVEKSINTDYSIQDKELIQKNPKLFEISSSVIGDLNRYLCKKIPDIEKVYVLQYLSSSSLNIANKGLKIHSKEILDMTNLIVQEISEKMMVNFNTKQMRQELANHLRPLVNRVKNHIEITNKLLPDIKKEYSKIFINAKEAVNKVFKEYYNQTISDGEIGFITLYFAKFSEQHPAQINILIMCASGVGTSELLRVKVHRSFPDLKIEDVVSLRQYKKKKQYYDERIDFIITTIDVENNDKQTILVNAMFTKNDKKTVEMMIKELKNNGSEGK